MFEHVTTFVGKLKFVDVAPDERPEGAYVEHRGSLYPAAMGYPMAVLVDQIGQPGQLVLIPHEQGLIAALAGTRRLALIRRDDENPDTLYMALLRMQLASSSFTPIGLGNIVGVPCEVANLNSLSLPPVIYTRKTILGIIVAITLVVTSVIGAFAADRYASQAAASVGAEMERVRVQTEDVLTQVSQLKAQVGQRPVRKELQLVTEIQEMPEPIQAFADSAMAYPADTTLRVVNGQIQTTGHR